MLRNRRRMSRRGFTLVEILLVVIILAMLAAFIVPNVFSQQEQANIDMAQTAVNGIEKQLTAYRQRANQYPTTEQGLKALVEKPEGENAPKKWVQLYEEVPTDPWDNEIQYEFPGEHNGEKKPDIWSMGPDGESGTEDDIGNWSTDEEESSGEI